MELLKLPKFKLELKAFFSEVKQLNEKERSASEQVQLMIQKQTQKEEEFGRRITDLQAELSLSNEIRKKLEKKVNFLESENCMLENKQKELKETITGLLQSKESFVQVYEDSFGGLKREIEDRDRKISILMEKIKAHTHLFNMIEKDANSIKQVVDNADRIVKERDEVVAGFKRKLDEVFVWEKQYLEKIKNLESQLTHCQEELSRKDKHILLLEAQLEASNFSEGLCPRVDELQNALSAKEMVIQNLVLEKQALQFEVGHLGFAMKKFQDAVSRMDQEDKKACFAPLDASEGVSFARNEVKRTEIVETSEDVCHQNTFVEEAVGNPASPDCQMCSLSTSRAFSEESELYSSVAEAAHSPALPAGSEPQLDSNAERDTSKQSLDQLGSDPSRSEAGNSCSRGPHHEDHPLA